MSSVQLHWNNGKLCLPYFGHKKAPDSQGLFGCQNLCHSVVLAPFNVGARRLNQLKQHVFFVGGQFVEIPCGYLVGPVWIGDQGAAYGHQVKLIFVHALD